MDIDKVVTNGVSGVSGVNGVVNVLVSVLDSVLVGVVVCSTGSLVNVVEVNAVVSIG